MPRFPDHLTGDGPHNPFPGVRVLERRLGREIPHQLGSNEGLDMPHRALREHFGDAMAAHVYSYGDAEALGIRRRLAEQKGIPLEAMLVDAGADSLIALSLRAATAAGDVVVSTTGTYPTFAYFARGHGCRLTEVPYDEGPGRLAPDLDALAAAAREQGARLVREVDDIVAELTQWLPAASPRVPADPLPAEEGAASGEPLLRWLSGQPTPVDTLVGLSGLGIAECQRRLLELELEGRVAHAAGGWVRLSGA